MKVSKKDMIALRNVARLTGVVDEFLLVAKEMEMAREVTLDVLCGKDRNGPTKSLQLGMGPLGLVTALAKENKKLRKELERIGIDGNHVTPTEVLQDEVGQATA